MKEVLKIMENKEALKYYLLDLITLLKEQAKKDAEKGNNDYNQGYLIAYYSVITLLKHQAFAFCIDQKELRLSNIDPETDLLGLHRNLNIDLVEDNWAIDVMNKEKIRGYQTVFLTFLEKSGIKTMSEIATNIRRIDLMIPDFSRNVKKTV